jgi:hypothetical protein
MKIDKKRVSVRNKTENDQLKNGSTIVFLDKNRNKNRQKMSKEVNRQNE